jgi:hypothetical protein
MDDQQTEVNPAVGEVAQEAPKSTGAASMVGGIDSLVHDLETFLDSVPVTAFHDRDADKVARAREKAMSLKDEVLLIRKMIEDAKTAIEGVKEGGERFASKVQRPSVRSVVTAYAKRRG